MAYSDNDTARAAQTPAALRLRRSALYVPAINERALTKAAELPCDVIILDLEDSVAAEFKDHARQNLDRYLPALRQQNAEIAIRINSINSPWGAKDLSEACRRCPSAIVAPKISTTRDVLALERMMAEQGTPSDIKIWAMIETLQGVMNLPDFAEICYERATCLAGFIVGTNDLSKELELRIKDRRQNLEPILRQVVIAARAGGVFALDGTFNRLDDLEGFAFECEAAAALGFDGKTLVHPRQVAPANQAFAPPSGDVEEAKRIVSAFDRPENFGKGVVALEGVMIERLHLDMAHRVLERARLCGLVS